MEEDFPESSLNDELQCSKTEDLRSLQDLNLDTHQDSQIPKLDLHCGRDQDQGQDQDPPPDQLEGQEVDQNPAGRGRDSVEDLSRAQQGQDQDQGQDQKVNLNQDQRADQHQHLDQVQDQVQDWDRDQDLPPANEQAAVESGGSVPALVITQAEESLRPASVGPAGTPEPQRPADLVPPDPSLSPDGGDMSCSDLLSLRSDSVSLSASRTSEEDDSRSVAASSVMSLFHRVQLDPVEKLWLRSSAVGNMLAQRQLLAQDPSLVLKKDFVSTALHWAAKQGRQEAVDMMLRSGADVNVRSGYTALHLASIHGHQHIVLSLINTHNANRNIRDYHGKTAVHYWSGCTEVFIRPEAPSGGTFVLRRRTQCYALPSLLLSRSRSQGQMNLEFGTLSPFVSQDVLDLQL